MFDLTEEGSGAEPPDRYECDDPAPVEPLVAEHGSAVLRGPAEWLAAAKALEISSVGDEELCDAALAVEELRRALDYVSLQVVAELAARGSTDIAKGMRTGPWLAREARLPGAATRSRVKVASKLRCDLPEVGEALADGLIGYDHARVFAHAANPRIVEEFRPFISDLVELAQLMTFDRWAREVRAVADLLDEDGGHRPGDDIGDNTLRISPFGDGTVAIEGQLTGDMALVVKDAITEKADQIFHRMTRDNRQSTDLQIPGRKTLLALALFELVREALGKPIGSTIAPRSEVSLVINASDPEHMTDVDGVVIGDTGSTCLTCDPVFQPVVVDTKGVVIDLGRDQRLVSRSQRRALAHRDGGCIFPGCEMPPEWTDAHHVTHWRRQGPTDMANLASLCRHHHGVSHRRGWSMHATGEQWFWWETPSGDMLWSQRHGTQRERPNDGEASRVRMRA